MPHWGKWERYTVVDSCFLSEPPLIDFLVPDPPPAPQVAITEMETHCCIGEKTRFVCD